MTSFKVYLIISLTWIGSTRNLADGVYYYSNFNLDNLGEQISREVNQKVAPLRDMGARIRARVNQQLEQFKYGTYQGNTYNNNNRQIYSCRPITAETPSVYHHQQHFSPPAQPMSPNVQSNLPPNSDLGRDNSRGQIDYGSRMAEAPRVYYQQQPFAPPAQPMAPNSDLGRDYSTERSHYNSRMTEPPREYYQPQQFPSQPVQFNGPVQSNLPPNQDEGLDNLGEHIEQIVYQRLEPVRAVEIMSKMKNGVGGTTIATFQPEAKKIIINNYSRSTCRGNISEDDGKCRGSLTPFTINATKDYCYITQGYSIINNYICVGASALSITNGVINCLGGINNPSPLLMQLDEFRRLCRGVTDSVEYRYIANSEDPQRVSIPNENRYVKCSNNQSGICVFTETIDALNYSPNIVNNVNYHNDVRAPVGG